MGAGLTAFSPALTGTPLFYAQFTIEDLTPLLALNLQLKT